MNPRGRLAWYVGVGWLAVVPYILLYGPAHVLWAGRLGPFSRGGAGAIWLNAGLATFVLLWLMVGVVAMTRRGLRPRAPDWRHALHPHAVIRRTGTGGLDVTGLVVGFVLLIASLGAVFWQPLALVLCLLFGVTLRLGKEPRQAPPKRTLPDLPLPPPPVQPPVPSTPTIPPGAPAPAPPAPGLSTSELRQWSWQCRFKPLNPSVRLSVRRPVVEQRRTDNPSPQGLGPHNWQGVVKRLAEEGAQDAEAVEAARQLLAVARQNRFNYFEEAQNTLQFVQSVPYQDDRTSKGMEYFRFPIETLYDDSGDCDCKAILAAALFRAMGLRSVVLVSADEGHAAVAVEGAPDYPNNRYFTWNGARYYFCETTDKTFGFTVGEVPPNVDVQSYTPVEIEPALFGAPTP